MTDHVFQLADGRLLGYACFGPDQGRPVLYFHGTPSSRLEPALGAIYGNPIEPLLERHHLKLISIDRPGMGSSTFHKGGTFASFADDVEALATALQLPPGPLLCWSGGGPYALAMARQQAQQITGVYIIAGFSRSFGEPEVYQKLGWNKVYFSTAQTMPLALKSTFSVIKHIQVKTPISQHLYELSDPDYALLKNVESLNAFMQLTMKEAVKKNTDGVVQEAAAYFEPLPFLLQTLQTPIHFWWGTEDTMVTYVHAKHLETAPQATPHYKKGEGHLSIYINCMEEVLQTVKNGI